MRLVVTLNGPTVAGGFDRSVELFCQATSNHHGSHPGSEWYKRLRARNGKPTRIPPSGLYRDTS